MKNFLMKLWKKKLVLLLTILFSFIGGYFVTDVINYFTHTYECQFTSSVSIDESTLLSKENLQGIKDSADKYSNIDVDSLVDNNGIYLVDNTSYYSIETYARYYDTFFLKSSGTLSTRAKMFIKDLLTYTYGEENITFNNSDTIITSKNDYNEFLIGGITLGVCFIGVCVLIFFEEDTQEKEDIYDNREVYRTPFHLSYWKSACTFLSSPKKISLLAMLLALQLLSKLITLPTGFANLGLSFAFIFFMITTMIFGPLAGLLVGALSDILGFFFFESSTGYFFFGYTLQAMLTGFIYGLMLYKTRVSYLKILITRIIIGMLCNVFLGSILWGIVAEYTVQQTIAYAVVLSLPKNLIYLIPQSVVVFLIIKGISPVLGRFSYLDNRIVKNISLV